MTQKNEVNFNLSFHLKGLGKLNLFNYHDQESEISGTIGSFKRISVVDDTLLEIQCSQGTLLISIPYEELKHFKLERTKKDTYVR